MSATPETARGARARASRADGQQFAVVGTKGQFVVPARLRRELHIEPGQRLRVETRDGRLIVTPLNGSAIQRLRGILAGPGPDPLAELMREHREEVEREEAEGALWRQRQRERADKVSQSRDPMPEPPARGKEAE